MLISTFIRDNYNKMHHNNSLEVIDTYNTNINANLNICVKVANLTLNGIVTGPKNCNIFTNLGSNVTVTHLNNYDKVIRCVQTSEKCFLADYTEPTMERDEIKYLATTVMMLFESIPDEMDTTWLIATNVLHAGLYLCACVAFFFNILNIVAIASAGLYKKTTYQLLINLAASDIVISAFLGVRSISTRYFTGETQMIINIAVDNVYQAGSMACVLTYTIISVDLLVQNTLPFNYECLKKVFKIVLILIGYFL